MYLHDGMKRGTFGIVTAERTRTRRAIEITNTRINTYRRQVYVTGRIQGWIQTDEKKQTNTSTKRNP